VNAADTQILGKLIAKLEKTYAEHGSVACTDLLNDVGLSTDPILRELVFSMLMWESSIEYALKGIEHISAELIDLNELRVCTPEELSTILSTRMPKSLDRSLRLIRILNTIFQRENKLSLVHLREMSKREAIEYLWSIDGMPPYVSSRVILLELGWHAFPVDDRLAKLLAKQKITDSSLDINQQTQRLERGVRANEALRYYTLIEHWSQPQRGSRSSTPSLSSANGSDTKAKRASNGAVSKSSTKGSS